MDPSCLFTRLAKFRQYGGKGLLTSRSWTRPSVSPTRDLVVTFPLARSVVNTSLPVLNTTRPPTCPQLRSLSSSFLADSDARTKGPRSSFPSAYADVGLLPPLLPRPGRPPASKYEERRTHTSPRSCSTADPPDSCDPAFPRPQDARPGRRHKKKSSPAARTPIPRYPSTEPHDQGKSEPVRPPITAAETAEP